MEVVYLLLALVAGFLLGVLYGKQGKQKLQTALQLAEKEREAGEARSRMELDALRQQAEAAQAALTEKWSVEKRAIQEKQEAEKLSYQQMLDSEREQHNRMVQQLKENFAESQKGMRAQFQQLAEEVMQCRTEELKKSNAEQLNLLMRPIKDEMGMVQKAVQDSRVSHAEQKAALEKSIEAMMRQTQQIGEDAVKLTKALKGSGKVQGDWGEQLLESILENSGLRREQEYFVQQNTRDEEGNNLRPDVVVRCPGGRHVVIDSKVSLTAYANYVAAEEEEERKRCARENLASVRKHIDELAAKNYDKLVEHTISHVLMFIPNEGSYILALQSDPQLGAYAFRKGVLVINPTNLMMALQLIYNLWQSERQSRNIEEIIRQSSDLYDKFVTFLETFDDVNEYLQKAQKSFDKARNQLSSGKGNIIRRLEGLKGLGVMPKKNIPEQDLLE